MAAAPKSKKRVVSDEHKAAMAAGRTEARAVKNYLDALELTRPKRGRKRTPDSINARLEKINAELAREGDLAASQVHRFLILHKELDPDDDELTRTRKVRRGFVGEKYAILVDALYAGRDVQHIETLVRFEDGRSRMVAADLVIQDARTFPPVAGKAA